MSTADSKNKWKVAMKNESLTCLLLSFGTIMILSTALLMPSSSQASGITGSELYAFLAGDEETADSDESTGPALLDDMHLFGQIQLIWNMVDEDDDAVGLGEIYEKEGFRLNRARFGIEGKVFEHVSYKFKVGADWDTEDNNVQFLDAYVDLTYFSFASLSLGSSKPSFSRQRLTSSRYLQLLDRAVVVEELAPDRDLGVTIYGRFYEGLFKYAAGFYNGNGEFFKGDDNNEYLWIARVEANPLGEFPSIESDFERDLKIGLGGSFFHNTHLETKSLGMGGDIEIKYKGASLHFEYIWAEVEPDFQGEDVALVFDTIERDGWFVQGGFFILPSILEVAARYEEYDDNNHLQDNGDIKYTTVGANYFLKGDHDYKIQLYYSWREEDGNKIENDSLMAQFQLAF